MAAPTTVEEFLELLRKSAVVDDKRLATALERVRAARPAPEDACQAADLLVREGVLTNFQAEQLKLGKWKRFSIGKYKVLERLGSGGMGSVYLCEHKVMRRRVAVKVLPSAKANDPAALERFHREARAVAALDHPNIVHAYDVDQDDTLHFLVMEYVDGASLQEMVKRGGPLDFVRAAHYIRQAAEGLRQAHLAGLVHRDVKPGNLMVDRTGLVKILDMGLARFFNDEDDILTQKYDENVLGTADYLAPEQATDSHSVDIRADIYSLGATFYYILSGKTPFGEGTIAQKLLWHQTRQPKPVRTLRPDLPEALSALIDKMMEKDAQNRHQTPGEVVDALEPWTRTPIAPPPEVEMPRLSPAVTTATSSAEVNLGISPAPVPSPSSVTRRNWQIVGGPTASTTTPPPAPAKPSAPAPPPKARSKADFQLGPEQAGKWMPFKTPVSVDAPAPSETRPQEDDSVPLEQPGPKTEDSQAQTDTPSQASPRKQTKPAVPPLAAAAKALAAPGKPSWLLLVLMGLLFLTALAFGLLFFFQGNAGPGAAGRAVRRVSTDPANAGTYPSIQQALRESKPGDRIILLDPVHEEAVVVDGVLGVSAVTVEAPEGAKVRWVAPSGHNPAVPLLRLSSAAGFHLKGNGIQMDGQKRIQTLVRISGDCPGLTLDHLEFKSFAKRAIHLVSCVGDARSPVRLLNLRTTTLDGESPDAAIVFEVDEQTLPRRKNNFVAVEQCRFLGLPFGVSEVSRNPTVIGENVRVP